MDQLFQRSEASERAAWESLYAGVTPTLRRELGLERVALAGGTLLSASEIDHPLLNRAIGLRPAPGAESATVNHVAGHYTSRKVARFWVHLACDQRRTSLPELLKERGIVRYPRSWMKFARRVEPMPPEDGAPTASPAATADGLEIGEILCQSFGIPAGASALFAASVVGASWHFFVVRDAGVILAASALRIQGNDAYLAFAATRESARNTGCQRALMRARIDLAARLGCTWVFTETGLPRPHEPNSSYRNMLRLGFDELCVRDNFAPEGTQWLSLPSSDASERSIFYTAPSAKPAKGVGPSGS
ncbi:MAG: GNAT family N-acetyltransferase [Polyangiales bacterium]